MGKFILVIIIGLGFWYWDRGELPFSPQPGAFDADDNPLVYLFTVKNCGQPCQAGRNDLKRRRVDFAEKQVNIGDDEAADTQLWKNLRVNNQFPLIVAGTERMVGASRPRIAGILGMNFGDQYLSKTEKRYFRNHFNADGSPRVVMYGTDWCGYCKRLREDLQANDMEFTEIDVEKSGEQASIEETMGVYGYPTTWVGYSPVDGTNLKAVKTALKNY